MGHGLGSGLGGGDDALDVILGTAQRFTGHQESRLYGCGLFGLKVWHELGHGYACKLFGGRVPEMGCKLIVGMPLAYVDASAAWSFPRRRDRILVMLGGMYFELLLAVPAALVWAAWPHSALGACAYQIVFMSGVATILFNINPLMKYDGYFILGDMLGISNLQARSVQEVKRVLKARVLGIEGQANSTADARDRLIFLAMASRATFTAGHSCSRSRA